MQASRAMSAASEAWEVVQAETMPSFVSQSVSSCQCPLTNLLDHITAMPIDENAPAGQYHGPPSRNQDIVSR